MAVSQDLKRDKAEGYKVSQKAELDTKDFQDWQVKFTTSNKSHEFKVEYEPADMNKDGQKV